LVNRSKYNTGEENSNKNLSGSPFTGTHQFHEKVLRKLNPEKNIKNVYITVEDMLDYDSETLKAKVNTESLSKLKFITEDKESKHIQSLAKFAQHIMDMEKTREKDGIIGNKTKQLHDHLIEQLIEFFEMRQANYSRIVGVDESNQSLLKFNLMKLKLLYDSLGYDTKVLMDIKQEIEGSTTKNYNRPESKVDTSWMGVRFGVEIPNSSVSHISQPKNLGVEMLNRNFMWCDDYFHYEDWGHMMKQSYDSFNLLVKTPQDVNDDEKFYFQDNWRRVPKGIFPDGASPRKLSFPNVKDSFKKTFLSKLDLQKQQELNNAFGGEHDMKGLVTKELLDSKNQQNQGKI